jgi:hypothetical protein
MTEAHPVAASFVKQAKLNGAKLIRKRGRIYFS